MQLFQLCACVYCSIGPFVLEFIGILVCILLTFMSNSKEADVSV